MKKAVKYTLTVIIGLAAAVGLFLLAGFCFSGRNYKNIDWLVCEEDKTVTFEVEFDARYYSRMGYTINKKSAGGADPLIQASYNNDITHMLGIGSSRGTFTFNAEELQDATVRFWFINRKTDIPTYEPRYVTLFKKRKYKGVG